MREHKNIKTIKKRRQARNKHVKQESLARIWILRFKSPTDNDKNISV
nr:MAG TPA: hypothetical protein [Caudoviricetes sp.]